MIAAHVPPPGSPAVHFKIDGTDLSTNESTTVGLMFNNRKVTLFPRSKSLDSFLLSDDKLCTTFTVDGTLTTRSEPEKLDIITRDAARIELRGSSDEVKKILSKFPREKARLFWRHNYVNVCDNNSPNSMIPLHKIDLANAEIDANLPLSPYVKLVVFSPEDQAQIIRNTIIKIANIGNNYFYIFSTPGKGRFFGNAEAKPTVGEKEQLEAVGEIRIETTVPLTSLKELMSRIMKLHPYDHPGFDIYPYFKNNESSLKCAQIWLKTAKPKLESKIVRLSENIKVSMLIPRAHGDKVRAIIGNIGTGVFGNYSFCSFSIEGIGQEISKSKAPYEMIETVASPSVISILDKLVKSINEVPDCENVSIDLSPLLEIIE